jgi:3',5'-cyclic AMP phosphodiesterase CpdA
MNPARTRLIWITDPHLGHAREAGTLPAFLSSLKEACAGADGLIVTGDFAESRELESFILEIAQAAATDVHFVLGNHDYYGGYVEEVRERVLALADRHASLTYLHRHGPVSLPGHVALVGTDGWGDARLGNWSSSKVILNDFHLVYDLAPLPSPELLARLRALGDESAVHLERVLADALREHDQVVVATHVPPFADAAWHEGKRSDPDTRRPSPPRPQGDRSRGYVSRFCSRCLREYRLAWFLAWIFVAASAVWDATCCQ